MRAQSAALTCLLLLFAAPVAAQERYDVEIIVFEHANDGAAAEEQWRAAIVAPDFERAGLLDAAGDGGLPETFRALPAREGQLRDAVRRLENSDSYRLLRHLRWRQPALEQGESLPVRVRAGEPVPISTPVNMLERPIPSRGNRRARTDAEEGAGGDNDAESGAAEAADPGTADDGATGADGPATDAGESGDYTYLGPYSPRERTVAVHPLDGTIELVVSRYLHLHVDLYRTVPVQWRETVRGGDDTADEDDGGGDAQDDAEADGDDAGTDADDNTGRMARSALAARARGPDGETMLSFPFRQSRRMRSGNLHYIDHPRLGVLVLVTPHEEEEEGSEGEGGDSDA